MYLADFVAGLDLHVAWCWDCDKTFVRKGDLFEYCPKHQWTLLVPPPPSSYTYFTTGSIPAITEATKFGSHPVGNIAPTTPNAAATSSLSPKYQQVPKPSRRAAKREKWESIKDEVRQLYVVEGKKLEITMAEIQRKHSFTASLRK